MDNYWYYTLSAIPQTLAAMIALSATFFVFKFNSIYENIKKNRRDLLRFSILLDYPQGEIDIIERRTDEEFLTFYKGVLEKVKPNQKNLSLNEEIYKKIEQELDRVIKDDWHSYFKADKRRVVNYLYAKRDFLENLLSNKKMIKNRLKWSLIITVFVVIASLSVLPHYDFFCSKPQLIVILMLFGFFISVIYTAYSVWKIATVQQ